MTTKAIEAGALLTKVKVLISSENADHMLVEGYTIPDVAGSQKDLKDQVNRISSHDILMARKSTLERDLVAEPPPPPEDERWGELTAVLAQIATLRFEGRSIENKIKMDMEKSLKDKIGELQLDKAKVSKVLLELGRLVSSDIYGRIEAGLEQFDNPGDKIKATVKIIRENTMGDQKSVRENSIQAIKNIPMAKDKVGIEAGCLEIRRQKMIFQRSLKMEGKTDIFPEDIALEALERICLQDPTAISIIRDCKKDIANFDTFEKVETAVYRELERIDNLISGTSKSKKSDPANEMHEMSSSSVMAMGASTVMRGPAVDLRNICITFNNTGLCKRGSSCRFSHVKTGVILAFPGGGGDAKVRGFGNDISNDRPLSPRDRSRERGEQRKRSDDRGSDRRRERDDRGGGDGGDRGGGGRDNRGGGSGGNRGDRDRENRGGDREGRDRSRSNSFGSLSSRDSGGGGKRGATPPSQKEDSFKRPGTPRRRID